MQLGLPEKLPKKKPDTHKEQDEDVSAIADVVQEAIASLELAEGLDHLCQLFEKAGYSITTTYDQDHGIQSRVLRDSVSQIHIYRTHQVPENIAIHIQAYPWTFPKSTPDSATLDKVHATLTSSGKFKIREDIKPIPFYNDDVKDVTFYLQSHYDPDAPIDFSVFPKTEAQNKLEEKLAAIAIALFKMDYKEVPRRKQSNPNQPIYSFAKGKHIILLTTDQNGVKIIYKGEEAETEKVKGKLQEQGLTD